MKLLPVFVLLLASSIGHAGPSFVTDAQTAFVQGEYARGLDILNRHRITGERGSEEGAEATLALAAFHETYTGNFKLALKLYRQIASTSSRASQPAVASARTAMEKLESLMSRNRSLDRQLKEIRIDSQGMTPSGATERIAKLEALIAEHPSYYRLPEAYYCLGLNHVLLDNTKRALDAFELCIQKWPAVDFHLGVTHQVKKIKKNRLERWIHIFVWGTSGLLLLLGTISFYGARPWKWLRFSHLMLCAGTLLVWWFLFAGAHGLLAHLYKPAPHTASEPLSTVYSNTGPDSPGSSAASTLFSYSLVGLMGICLFSIAVGRVKPRWIAVAATSVFGFLIMTSLSGIFYLRHCQGQGEFASSKQGLLRYVAGAFRFTQDEPESFILIDPKAYPHLNLNDATPETREWVLQNSPHFSRQKGENR